MNDPMLAKLAEVFEVNRQRRAGRAATAIALLRPYERRLLQEAAVMGYVLGARAGRVAGSGIRGELGREEPPVPSDAAIVQTVLEHCDSTSDLYPYLAAACDGKRRRVTKARRWAGEETR